MDSDIVCADPELLFTPSPIDEPPVSSADPVSVAAPELTGSPDAGSAEMRDLVDMWVDEDAGAGGAPGASPAERVEVCRAYANIPVPAVLQPARRTLENADIIDPNHYWGRVIGPDGKPTHVPGVYDVPGGQGPLANGSGTGYGKPTLWADQSNRTDTDDCRPAEDYGFTNTDVEAFKRNTALPDENATYGRTGAPTGPWMYPVNTCKTNLMDALEHSQKTSDQIARENGAGFE